MLRQFFLLCIALFLAANHLAADEKTTPSPGKNETAVDVRLIVRITNLPVSK
jgi:hypothetical protein